MVKYRKLSVEKPTQQVFECAVYSHWSKGLSVGAIIELIRNKLWLSIVLDAEKRQKSARKKTIYSLLQPRVLLNISHCDSAALRAMCDEDLQVGFDQNRQLLTATIGLDSTDGNKKLYRRAIQAVYALLRHEFV